MTVQDLYASAVRPLPPSERLQLATPILGGLPVADALPVDVSDEWTDEDIADMTAHSLRYAATEFPPGGDEDA